MNLKEILAISGAPGLFRYVAQGKGGIIVESLVDDKRSMVSGTSKVSALGDIAMFTDAAEVSIADVFTTIYAHYKGEQVTVSGKSTPAELQAFMEIALPAYDRDRVHNSDVKKLASWYNILVKTGMTTFTVEDPTTDVDTDVTIDSTTADSASSNSTSETTNAVKHKATTTKKATTASASSVKTKAAPVKSAGAVSSKAKVATKNTANRKSGI